MSDKNEVEKIGRELEEWMWDESHDFDLDTWGDIRFNVTQDFIAEFIKQKLQATEEENQTLKQRELKLEAIVSTMMECYFKSYEENPIINRTTKMAHELMLGLFNEAEVRSNIEDLVKIDVEFEK